MIYVLAGKHSSGKGYLLSEITKKFSNLERVPFIRSRPQRRDEVNTKQTPFCTNLQFEKMIKNGEILLYEQFLTNGQMYYYGIHKNALSNPKKDYVLELSPMGIEQLKLAFDDVKVIFIYTIPIEREDRYIKRGGVYTKKEFDDREFRDAPQFNKLKWDYFIINSVFDKDNAINEITKIIKGGGK